MRTLLLVALFFLSSALFAAQKEIEIENPRGGEVYSVEQKCTIRLNSKTKAKMITVEISRDGGSTFDVLGKIDNNKKPKHRDDDDDDDGDDDDDDDDRPKKNQFRWFITGPETDSAIIRCSDDSGRMKSGKTDSFRIRSISSPSDLGSNFVYRSGDVMGGHLVVHEPQENSHPTTKRYVDTCMTDLQGQITTNKNDQTNLQNQITTNQTSITNNQGQITTNQTNITACQGQVTVNQTSITTNQTSITNNQTTITNNHNNLQGQITANKNDAVDKNTLDIPTQTRYCMMNFACFRAEGSGNDSRYTADYVWLGSVKVESFLSTVAIPDGAILIGVRAYVYDNRAADDISVQLVKLEMETQTSSVISNLTTNGAETNPQVLDDSLGENIDISANSYYIKVSWNGGDEDIRFSGVRITYEVDKPLP